MKGWLPRWLTAVLATLGGGALGYGLGLRLQTPVAGVLVGAVLGASLVSARDAWRGYRLLRWLSGSQAHAAPRDRGFWGEMGYRVERALRLREKEAALERTRLAQFLSAIEASPNGVLLLGANDQIEWCNAEAAAHFGLDPARDRGQHVTNLVRLPAFVAYLQAGDFTEPVALEQVRGRDTLSVQVRCYGEGQKLVLSQDISERERSERMRREFVANVSHEIRTPLTVLSGFVETLSDLPLTEVERRRVLALMGQQAQRMQTLVADLLTLAQLEGSPRPPSDRWVPVQQLLTRAQTDGMAMSMARHQFQFGHVDASVALAGSEAELLSAVVNLVTNAVRYTPEGGQIRASWQVRDDGAGVITVSDTGIGIAREHLPRLTERFYRVDGSRSRDTGGTGLGLSIVKHVLQRHGGELDVQSELGKGASFRLIFPAVRVRVAPPAPEEVPEAAEASASDAQAPGAQGRR